MQGPLTTALVTTPHLVPEAVMRLHTVAVTRISAKPMFTTRATRVHVSSTPRLRLATPHTPRVTMRTTRGTTADAAGNWIRPSRMRAPIGRRRRAALWYTAAAISLS
jgi:hypothetical protein